MVPLAIQKVFLAVLLALKPYLMPLLQKFKQRVKKWVTRLRRSDSNEVLFAPNIPAVSTSSINVVGLGSDAELAQLSLSGPGSSGSSGIGARAAQKTRSSSV